MYDAGMTGRLVIAGVVLALLVTLYMLVALVSERQAKRYLEVAPVGDIVRDDFPFAELVAELSATHIHVCACAATQPKVHRATRVGCWLSPIGLVVWRLVIIAWRLQ